MPRGPTGMGAVRGAAGVAAVLAAPWLFRALAVFEGPTAPAAANLRGIAADFGVGLLLLSFLWLLARWAHWLGVLLVGLLALGYYANYETITALGTVASSLDLTFLADPTFLRGSAFALAQPVALAAGLIASLALAWYGLRGASAADAFLALVGAGLLLGGLSLWPTEPRYSLWRQVNVLGNNVAWLAAARGEHAGGFANPADAMRELVPSIAADLDAPLRFEFDGRGMNVLLVVLESVSGHYLPTAARQHGRVAVNTLNRLDHTFAENVGYATFFTHSRRTNRGLFALLCGEYPRLVAGLPKMSVTAGAPWRRCLPEVLREHGYRTVYIQSAPLAFMHKDRFMPKIGFDEVLGHNWFEREYLRTYWGVDDRTLFEHTLEKIDELASQDGPWFLTVLNVGTHHPYVVPDSYQAPRELPIGRAFSYMDLAFGRFLRAIELRGLRDDTLVLVTSDESRGDLGQAADGMAAILSENWGFLVALLPERTRLIVDEPFAQSDVALSVVDYLGIPHADLGFFGRSVFRRYKRGRTLFYGNLNYRMIGGLKPDGTLVQCQREGRECARYRPTDGRIFASQLPQVSGDARFADTVREMAWRSLPPRDDAPLVLPLLSEPIHPVRRGDWEMVQGVSQISLEPNEWIEIDLEVESLGPGRIQLIHRMRLTQKRGLVVANATLEPGQTLRLRYTLSSDLRISQATIRTRARLLEGATTQLRFRKRRFELRRSGERPAQGVHLELAELDPPSGDPAALFSAVSPIEMHADFLRRRERKGMTPDDLEGAGAN